MRDSGCGYFCHCSFKNVIFSHWLYVLWHNIPTLGFLCNILADGKFSFENNLPVFPAAWKPIESHNRYLVPIVTHKLQSRPPGNKNSFPWICYSWKTIMLIHGKNRLVNLADFLAKHAILLTGNYSIIDFKCWSVVISECFITPSLPNLLNEYRGFFFSFFFSSLLPPSLFPAMVQQFHESHLCVVGWQIGPSASYLPTEDAHQDCEGKQNVFRCELPSKL